MKSPEILVTAIRQYRHNNQAGMIHAYDQKETDKIVTNLLSMIRKKDIILAKIDGIISNPNLASMHPTYSYAWGIKRMQELIRNLL